MKNTLLAAAAVSAVMLALPAAAQDRTEAGMLTCDAAGGVGFVFGSTRELACTFQASDGVVERYVGQINRFGIDLGVTGNSVITWGVLAPTSNISPWTLAGTYAGVGGEATVGVGVGANAMIGGSNDTIVLQPISVSAQTGVNVAAGITEIELAPAQ